ncbi:tetraspanin-33 isoform X3 [Cyprinodon tularosa]|uniref:tetraspanin-33 isoform X3 n=1 Tax=Cyprinodon tularosa TaxID=77115 RepID=UPI0018E1EDC4|nr:tetraspanin-33 isoform X3 [Cyprinodon tularosa]
MEEQRRGASRSDKDFTFISPVVKYLLFLFNFIFWVVSLVMVAIGVYARVIKHAETTLFCISLIVIFIIQLAAGILAFIFSDKARHKVTEIINNAIVHYRDDVDLQNLIDYGQKEFRCCGGTTYTDWSKNVYFNCSPSNPSKERCSVPYSCCIPSQKKEVPNTQCGLGMQEKEFPTENKFYTDGCIDKMVDWIHSNLFILGGIALGLAIPQLVGMLLSQILINQIKDQIELQNYNLRHRSDPWS